MPMKYKKKSKNLKETTDQELHPESIKNENLEAVYKLNNPCKFTACRRNCRANPLCLSGLGETQWLTKCQESEKSYEDPKQEYREQGAHVGLQNLGATCYVNSLLQLWFHTPKFRQAIFDWNPLEDPIEQSNPTVTDNEAYQPISEIGHLQVLFALMCYSKRSHLDPTDFIESLGLDTSTQQDAQEFSKLFVSLLESQLKNQSLPYVRNLISDNFCGEYSYITRCSKCKTESVSPSLFYELELNVKGHKTLDESLSEFLAEEKLEGADRYSCAVCKDKQEAARFISLQTLPPILNFQLMRFIYDRQKGYKKKLNTALQFPEVLDMKKYMDNGKKGDQQSKENPPDQLLYNLTAVLLHRGTSANSGHYIAYIRDMDSGVWYTFNDQTVERCEGKKLKLNLEDAEDGVKKNGNSRLPKGFLSSTKSYMLVYTRGTEKSEETVKGNCAVIDNPQLSERLQAYVRRHNDKFDTWIDEAARMRACCLESGNEFRQQMATLILSMPAAENGDCSNMDAVKAEWICHWLKNCSGKTDAIDNTTVVCPHGSLNPDCVSNVKYISKEAADELYMRYGGGPRLQGDLICCRECIALRYRLIHSKNRLMDDYREISNLLKIKMEDGEPGFWVDKESLKYWKTMVDLENERINNLTDDQIGQTSEEDTNSDKLNSSNVANLDSRDRSPSEKANSMSEKKEQMKPSFGSEQIKNQITTKEVSGLVEAIINGCAREEDEQTKLAFARLAGVESRNYPSKRLSPASVKRRTKELRSVRKLNFSSDDTTQSNDVGEGDNVHKLSQNNVVGTSFMDYNENCNGNVPYANGFGDEYILMDKFREMDNVLNSMKTSFENCHERGNDTVTLNKDVYVKLKTDLDRFDSVYIKIKNCIVSFMKDNNSKFSNIERNNLETSLCKGGISNKNIRALTSEPVSLNDNDTCSSNSDRVEMKKDVSKVKQKKLDFGCISVNGDSNNESRPDQSVIDVKLCEASETPTAGRLQHHNSPVKAKIVDSCAVENDKEEKPEIDENHLQDYIQEEADGFNEGLACPHGNLTIDESTRRLVSVKVWEILKKYFPLCRSFPHDTPPCLQCKCLASEDEVVKDQYRKSATVQKEQLKDLFIGRNRPETLVESTTYYLLPKEEFLNQWKKFIRKPEGVTALNCLDVSVLLCQHGKLMYSAEDVERLCLVTEDEWAILISCYPSNNKVTARLENGVVETDPEICFPCLDERLEAEDKAQLQYTSANVYVQKVETIDVPIINNSLEPKNKKLKTCPSSTVRRSSRRRKVRGEKVIPVSSTMTVKNFKILVMNAFEVATFDQYLVSEEGREMNDNNCTLRELEIYPESTVFLKVDEASGMEYDSCTEDFSKKREPEAGFKGTKLIA